MRLPSLSALAGGEELPSTAAAAAQPAAGIGAIQPPRGLTDLSLGGCAQSPTPPTLALRRRPSHPAGRPVTRQGSGGPVPRLFSNLSELSNDLGRVTRSNSDLIRGLTM